MPLNFLGAHPVPDPEWALFDLVRHLRERRREWSYGPPSRPWPSLRGRGGPGWPHRRAGHWARCGKSARIAEAGRRRVRGGRR